MSNPSPGLTTCQAPGCTSGSLEMTSIWKGRVSTWVTRRPFCLMKSSRRSRISSSRRQPRRSSRVQNRIQSKIDRRTRGHASQMPETGLETNLRPSGHPGRRQLRRKRRGALRPLVKLKLRHRMRRSIPREQPERPLRYFPPGLEEVS